MTVELPHTFFSCPEWIEDTELRTLFEIMAVRLQDEMRGLPMPTVTMILAERICTNYVILRWRERAFTVTDALDDDGNTVHTRVPAGFNHATEQKDFNTFFLSMMAEFNKQLTRYVPQPTARQNVINEVNLALQKAFRVLEPTDSERFRLAFLDAINETSLPS